MLPDYTAKGMEHEIAEAIRGGDLSTLNKLLAADPTIVKTRIDGQRTLLHIATDWPGHFPHVRETITALVARGADVNAPFQGRHAEAPLHWAASSGDTDALDALLDHGANIEAPGSVIGGGTPLADAVAFGQWRAAHRLIERGARATIWQAAALGLMDRVKQCFDMCPLPTRGEVTNAFWSACHGGQLETASYLLYRGASLNWVGYSGLSPLGAAMRNGNQELIAWLRDHGAI